MADLVAFRVVASLAQLITMSNKAIAASELE